MKKPKGDSLFLTRELNLKAIDFNENQIYLDLMADTIIFEYQLFLLQKHYKNRDRFVDFSVKKI